VTIDFATRLEAPAPAPAARHVAQFYEGEEFLLDAVERFVDDGLRAGDGIVVVATRPHLDALASRIRGPALREAVDAGRAMMLDARETLSGIVVDGTPDASRFDRSVERVLDRCVRASLTTMPRSPRVRAFGEMVDLLCRDGRHDAAVRLERLWNRVAEDRDLSIFCGYAMAGFSGEEDAGRFDEVCAEHDHIVPAETSAKTDDVDALKREIARLQQRAHALKGEVGKRAELEQALRQALRDQHRAEHTSRVRDALLAAVSQELRRPLKTIVSWSSLLRSAQPVDASEAAEAIELSAHAQYQLLDDLSDASRVVGGTLRLRPGPADLAFVLRAAVEAVSHAAITKDITIEVTIASDPCLGHADTHRIEQVLSNLLSNAVQFTHEGGRVSVSLERSDDEIEFIVRDDGCGIGPAALPFIFDRLRCVADQASARPDGMRLGLAVARHLVELHGGSIAVHSDGPGRGSTFTVRLPRRAALAGAVNGARSP
jgi:signal transduction histidine kinase